jgi:hypothetical protein
MNAIDQLYTNAGFTEVEVKQYATAEEALADNGGLASTLQACLDEKVKQGIEIEAHWDRVEKSRPLTTEENDIARESLVNVRRDLAAFHKALIGLKKFEALAVSSRSVN